MKSVMVSVAERRQLRTELSAGMENTAFDCSHGNAQLLCDFIVVEAFHEHVEWNLEFRLETVDGTADVLLIDHRCNGVGLHRARIQVELVVGGIQYGVLELLALIVIDEDVAHDRVQPSFDVRTLFEVVLVAERFHHGVLNQVFRILGIPRKTDGEAFEELAVGDQQSIEF